MSSYLDDEQSKHCYAGVVKRVRELSVRRLFVRAVRARRAASVTVPRGRRAASVTVPRGRGAASVTVPRRLRPRHAARGRPRPTGVPEPPLSDRGEVRTVSRRSGGRARRTAAAGVGMRTLEKVKDVLDVVAVVTVQPPRFQLLDVVNQRRQLHLTVV